MTNHWIDLKNTDCALILGANPSENHPLSFKWLLEAKKNRGAKIIVVDPRFTRSASRADIYAPLRSGTDIAFVGGLMYYILSNNLYHLDYIKKYTNAAFLVNEGFGFTDGLFTGYDPGTRTYNKSTWVYQTDAGGVPLKDETLTNPRTVFQIMLNHYSRYTATTVSAVTGMTVAKFNEVAAAFAATGAVNKTGTIMYAMGCTQHTVGSQNVKSYAMLQLLLGNMGRPGGGVNAMRGESNVQGSTDMGLLNNNLTGYLASPIATADYATLAGYLAKETPASGYWINKPKFFTSLLKAWWGANAISGNEYCYQYLPKRSTSKGYSHIQLFETMYDAARPIRGLFCFGQNPVVAGPNANKESTALKNLDWLVCVDLFSTETANFFNRPGTSYSTVNTEVFLLPAAASFEKEGSISNSGRWIQYRWKAANPPGEAKSDLWIMYNLMQRIQNLYASSLDPKDDPVKQLTWSYGVGEPSVDLVAKEINGYYVADGTQLPGFSVLTDTGTTACGCWIMSGMYPSTGNKTMNRDNTDPDGYGHYRNWAYSWPANRRILYNRASADWAGAPWSADKTVIWWSGTAWTGYDVPDFAATKAPTDPGGTDPFIMKTEGVGGLFATLNEGPFPEHYEPYETPTTNSFSSQQFNPVALIFNTALNAKGEVATYPVIATTFRHTEHWQGGAMTRNCTWLQELVPNQTVEISPGLASSKRISNGGNVIIQTARGQMTAKAMITDRVKPLLINGQTFEVIALPWHFGFKGLATGDSANTLTCHVGDANTLIPEYKAFLCKVLKG